jgi:hypothetical protein
LRVHSSTKSRTRLDQSKNFSVNLKAIELQDAANDSWLRPLMLVKAEERSICLRKIFELNDEEI